MAKRKRVAAVDWQSEAERLREALIRVEALAHAADGALMDLPYGRTIAERLALRRLAVFVEAFSLATSEALIDPRLR